MTPQIRRREGDLTTAVDAECDTGAMHQHDILRIYCIDIQALTIANEINVFAPSATPVTAAQQTPLPISTPSQTSSTAAAITPPAATVQPLSASLLTAIHPDTPRQPAPVQVVPSTQ